MTTITKPTPFPTVQQLLDVVQPTLSAAAQEKRRCRKSQQRGSGNLPGLLRRACRQLQIDLNASADALLGPSLDQRLTDLNRDESLPPKTRNNLKWALKKWQVLLDRAYPGLLRGIPVDAPSKPPLLLQLSEVLRDALRVSGLTVPEVATRTGVPESTLRRWIVGRSLPDERSRPVLPAVERTLGLVDGDLVPFLKKHRARHAAEGAAPCVPWSVTGQGPVRTGSPTLRLEDFPEPLKSAWRTFVREQTERRVRVRGRKRKPWAVHAVKSATRGAAWYCEVDGKECPTADRYWRAVSGFLAFTQSEAFLREIGETSAPVSLGWLAVSKAVNLYAETLIEGLDDVVNGTVRGFVGIVSLLCGEGGFLRRKASEIGAELPVSQRSDDWSRSCDDAVDLLLDLISEYDAPERNWDEFMRLYLEHQDPATPVLAGIAKLLQEADSMRSSSLDRARLLRDAAVLSLQLLMPLRRRTLANLEWRTAAKHLTLQGDRITVHLPRRLTKNGPMRGEFKTTLQGELVHVIRRYLEEARPVLCNGIESPWLFVSSRRSTEPWTGISVQIREVTARTCGLGISGHMFRHLVAVRFLRQHPKDYVGVAALLHDSLATVLKQYAPKDPTHAFDKNSAGLRLPSS